MGAWAGGRGSLVDLVSARRERIDAGITLIELEGERQALAAEAAVDVQLHELARRQLALGARALDRAGQHLERAAVVLIRHHVRVLGLHGGGEAGCSGARARARAEADGKTATTTDTLVSTRARPGAWLSALVPS